MPDKPSRRTFLIGTSTAALATGALTACSSSKEGEGTQIAPDEAELGSSTVAFDGEHQAGIATPHPSHMRIVAFDIADDRATREDMIRLMNLWTEDARRMCSGMSPRADLAEELSTLPANLTITVGYGPSLFEKLGLAAPDWLKELPAYEHDELIDDYSGGDLVLQICADDPMTVAHASRFLTAAGKSYVKQKWAQDGFLHAHGAIPSGYTMRNHFGQLDGTGNPGLAEFDDVVWINDGPEWLRGGTAMVVRRIEMHLDTWDMLDRPSREAVIGRTLGNGAPLTGTEEFDEPDLEARDEYGLPVIDPNSHMARAKAVPGQLDAKIFRRPYNYLDADSAGQIFICFQQDPMKQFNVIQERLSEADRLNEWITHIGSAVFAVPGGTRDGQAWGGDLFN